MVDVSVWDDFRCSVLHFFQLTSGHHTMLPYSRLGRTIVLYNWGMLQQFICLKDIRMRPSIAFFYADAV